MSDSLAFSFILVALNMLIVVVVVVIMIAGNLKSGCMNLRASYTPC